MKKSKIMFATGVRIWRRKNDWHLQREFAGDSLEELLREVNAAHPSHSYNVFEVDFAKMVSLHGVGMCSHLPQKMPLILRSIGRAPDLMPGFFDTPAQQRIRAHLGLDIPNKKGE